MVDACCHAFAAAANPPPKGGDWDRRQPVGSGAKRRVLFRFLQRFIRLSSVPNAA